MVLFHVNLLIFCWNFGPFWMLFLNRFRLFQGKLRNPTCRAVYLMSLGTDELCDYCLAACQATVTTTTVVVEEALQRSVRLVQDNADNNRSMQKSRMVVLNGI